MRNIIGAFVSHVVFVRSMQPVQMLWHDSGATWHAIDVSCVGEIRSPIFALWLFFLPKRQAGYVGSVSF